MEKTAIITGASRGIGAEIAKTLAKEYRVAVCYKNSKNAAEEVVTEIENAGGTAKAFYVDVADENSVKTMVAEVKSTFGIPRVLVNNAGIAEQKLFTDISAKDWDDMFAVHTKGAFLCSKAVLTDMINAKSGVILNITSMWGIVGASCEVHYSAAKAALIGMTKALAKELAPSGIRVNAIAPGVIDTDMLSSFSDEEKLELAAETPLSRIGTAKDVANAAEFLVSDKSSFITGQILSVDGGFIL